MGFQCRWTKFLVIFELAPVPSLVWAKLLVSFIFSQVKDLGQLALGVGWRLRRSAPVLVVCVLFLDLGAGYKDVFRL